MNNTRAGGGHARWLLAIVGACTWLAGCAPAPVEDAGEAPAAAGVVSLGTFPVDEYWMHLAFQGAPVGFTHLSIDGGEAPDEYALRSEAVMNFSLLGVKRRTVFVGTDWVNPDLSLRRFRYRYQIDEKRFEVEGRIDEGRLAAKLIRDDGVEEQELALRRPLYPSAVSALYPVLHGLELGREYAYVTYDGATQRTTNVVQKVVAYEKSGLFEGNAFRVQSQVQGQEVNTWIDERGRPVLERSMGGLFVAGWEDPEAAKELLTFAALNKDPKVAAFTRVPSDVPLESPHELTGLTLRISGLVRYRVPSGAFQRCRAEAEYTLCRITSAGLASAEQDQLELFRYQHPSPAVPSDDERIVALSVDILAAHTDPRDRVEALLAWLAANVERAPAAALDALDALQHRQAESQGFAYLYAALARAGGIATRLSSGLVYSSEHEGFMYHVWAESWLGEAWVRVDPTLGQLPADATHVRLADGELIAELTPLARLLGRLSVRVDVMERAKL